MTEPAATVYVIDDDPAMREALDSLIRARGFRALLFGSAQEFLRAPEVDAPQERVLQLLPPQEDVLGDGEIGHKREFLIDHRDPVLAGLLRAPELYRVAVHVQLSLVRCIHAGQDFDERGLELGIPGIGRPSDRTSQLVPRDAAQVPDSPGLAGMGGPHFGDPLAEGRKDTPPQGNRRTCTRGFITNM